jgi:poly-gamma-glutamate synthesis protein (capsule biosynthesis protein)
MKNFDWNTGAYRAHETQEKATFRITVASDWGALWDYEPIMQREPLEVYGDLLPLFLDSDLNIVNVECGIGTQGAPILKGGPNLRSTPGAIDCLTKVPFHVACLANNHSMDFGPESLHETIALLNGAGIKTVGAGMNGAEATQPLRLNMNGATLAIVNCAEGEACASLNNGPGSHPFDIEDVARQIRELRQQGDAVVVIFHGGREYAPVPPPYVVDGLRRFVAAGADAIIGHHPHVPQGIEIYEGVPIAYSQGNFVFRWAQRDGNLYASNTGYLTHLDFVGKELTRFSITPYRATPQGLRLLPEREKPQLLQELKHRSEPLADPMKLQQVWDAFVDVHGADGMFGLLESLSQRAGTDSCRSAAIFHNLFYSPAHRELYLNGMKRLSRGELGNSPQWARDLVQDWATRAL